MHNNNFVILWRQQKQQLLQLLLDTEQVLLVQVDRSTPDDVSHYYMPVTYLQQLSSDNAVWVSECIKIVTRPYFIEIASLIIKFFVNIDDSGVQPVAVAKITIDRSDFDVRYGSGSFFDNLGDKTIYDEFDLEVKLVVEQA